MKMKRSVVKNRIIILVLVLSLGALIGQIEKFNYKKAEKAITAENYESAEKFYKYAFVYKDSQYKYSQVYNYKDAVESYKNNNYEEAKERFKELAPLWESENYINLCEEGQEADKEQLYYSALNSMDREDYYRAILELKTLSNYKNSKKKIDECYNKMQKKMGRTIASGSLYTIAIGESKLYSTGKMDYNQNKLEFDGLRSLDAGGYYSIGLYDGDLAKCAGNIPWYNIEVDDFYNVLQVSAAFDYVVVLHKDWTVECRGYLKNDDGEEVDTSQWNNIVMIDSGYHLTAGLDAYGKVFVTGQNSQRIQKEIDDSKEWNNITQIAVGGGSKKSEGFVIGLKDNGKIVTAGKISDNISAEINKNNIKSISAGDYHIVYMTDKGKLMGVLVDEKLSAWKELRCVNFEKFDGKLIKAFDAGNQTTVVVFDSGEVMAVGYDYQKQIPRDGEWTNVLYYD